MLVDKILKHFNAEEKDRQFANPIRMSNAGKCARAMAYQLHGFQGEPLNARARMVFRLGDLVEQDLVDACAKCANLVNHQEKVSVTIAGKEIHGHIDAELPAENDRPDMTVDFKSISEYGFKRAEKGEVDHAYICQAHCYMKAKNQKQFLFVYYCKNTSHLAEVVVHWDDAIWEEIVNRFTSVFNSTKENLPAKEFGPIVKTDKKGKTTEKLDWRCSYCAYARICWPDYELTFDGNGKPSLTKREEA